MSGRSPARPRAALPGLAALALAFACGAGEGSEPPERLVLVVVDTLRRDHVGAYADGVHTPNIDALAEEGQVFTRVVASFHQTSMSMGALFTGHTPSLESGDPQRTVAFHGRTWCGLSRFARRGDAACVPASLRTLGEALGEAGYWTIGVVSNPFLFTPAGFERGFDAWSEVGEAALGRFGQTQPWRSRRWRRVNEAAYRAVRERASDRFFLYVHYMDVHDHGMRPVSYAETVFEVDRALGALLQFLEREGLRRGTTVFLTSDHGERLGERHALRGRPSHVGNPSFEELLRIPLVVAPPVHASPGAFLRSEDVFELLLRVAGAEASAPPETLEDEELFVGELRFLTYRRGRFKSTTPRARGGTALFDLEADPGETRDVAGLHPAVVAAHRERAGELVERLAADRDPEEGLSEEDRARLEALGYLE